MSGLPSVTQDRDQEAANCSNVVSLGFAFCPASWVIKACSLKCRLPFLQILASLPVIVVG